MVVIEYNKVKVSVPENWGDIELGFYETFYTKKPETARERVELVAHICKIDADMLLGWPAEVFNVIVDRIGFLFGDNPAQPNPAVEINGVKYIVPIEEELSLGAWVDADDVQKNGEAVLSNILAIVCRPTGEEYDCRNNEARAAMFASQPVSRILGVLAFFLHYRNALYQRTNTFSKIRELVDQLPRSTGLLRCLGGGIKVSRTWQIIKYYALIASLRYRLRKFSPSCNTKRIRSRRKKHKEI